MQEKLLERDARHGGNAPGAEVVITRCSHLAACPGLLGARAPAALLQGAVTSLLGRALTR